MVITAVEPRKKHLCAIYIDGEFAFNLDRAVTEEHNLNVGTALNDEEIHSLLNESDFRRAKEKAMWLISFRDYSRKELEDKLLKDYSEDSVQKCLDRLEEIHLLDDERFAKRYAKDLFEIKKLSVSNVKYKLMEKGIDKYLIEDIIDDIEPDENEQISQLLNTKYFRSMFDEKGRKRTIAALQRIGYKWSVIRSAIDAFDEENEYPDCEDDIYD